MAASANPAGNQDGSGGLASFQGGGGGGTSGNAGNGNSSAPPPENPGPTQALKHDPGLSLEWTPEEQAILEEGLAKHGSDMSVIRYAKIAMLLPDKTVRDVAMRHKWMNRKGCSKKRKEDHNQARKISKKNLPQKQQPTPQPDQVFLHILYLCLQWIMKMKFHSKQLVGQQDNCLSKIHNTSIKYLQIFQISSCRITSISFARLVITFSAS